MWSVTWLLVIPSRDWEMKEESEWEIYLVTVLGCFLCLGQVCQWKKTSFSLCVLLPPYNINNNYIFLQSLCTLYFDPSWPRGTGTGLTSQSRGHSTLLWSCWLFWYWGLPGLWFGDVLNNSEGNYCLIMKCFFLRVHFARSLV